MEAMVGFSQIMKLINGAGFRDIIAELKCTVSRERIPDIIDRNFKKDYQILIFFGTNIADVQLVIRWPLSFHLTQRHLMASCVRNVGTRIIKIA